MKYEVSSKFKIVYNFWLIDGRQGLTFFIKFF